MFEELSSLHMLANTVHHLRLPPTRARRWQDCKGVYKLTLWVSGCDAKRLQEVAILQHTQGVPSVQQVPRLCMVMLYCQAVLSALCSL